jgi:hypothetical protein
MLTVLTVFSALTWIVIPGSSSAFTTEGNVDAQYPQERLSPARILGSLLDAATHGLAKVASRSVGLGR